jgi:hypothetical protein
VPIITSLIVFGWAIVAGKVTPHSAKLKMDYAVELFLGLSFILFSSVSTTIFETFNCAR